MKKVDSLRKMLLAAVPALKANPERLSLFVDKGAVRARRTATLSYELAYTLSIWIEAFAGDTDRLFVPVLAWVGANQPDLLDRAEHQPFTFESELLDQDSSDLLLTIELTERVRVVPREDGKLRTHYLDDAPIEDVFPGAEDAVLSGGIVYDDVADELVATL